ncbi:5-(carboxyamino)imidazole ribonucleotide synthase [Canibacter sp. lx-72]|uniref:5-(carboxyamino)imidazole ribonucleotide synthase n=1 Tax=Canibacter zhuwentaonis TaxID=2837491 RepID=UPI001BDC7384|nr:5-(carboxyamino)imidazole ribonucleotide synthase [Canibacter zhuwentaonis]MBT1018649.1 5-(carboxyamino)imidazole ribonucleotide synthase [Canibacter zhuwentaonis]MBT1035841.1 5-(carboxyamino)imidazole ribonucleotide synthase [Canibacter zhuwentaonis]
MIECETKNKTETPQRIRVGVIGGGQLARMMVPPALHLGLEISVLAESEGMSAARAADAVGDYRDLQTVLDFAANVDVVTFDHEHVPGTILTELQARGHAVYPPPQALQYAQNKLLMREKLVELKVATPKWMPVKNETELADFLAECGGKAVVKTLRGGYDGKGVRVITGVVEVADWLRELAPGDALLAEELVNFKREVSQLVARRPDGEMRVWPLVETVQKNGVCAEVIAPAPVLDGYDTSSRAAQIGKTIAEGAGAVGVVAVEMFECANGDLLVNELAMRPHNSGHFTIEGSVTSQFEQHLRAVCNLPLGEVAMTAPVAVMINVLGGPSAGSMLSQYQQVLAQYPAAKVHSYGKASRPGRKVGHVTVTGDNLSRVLADAHAAARLFDA